MSKKNGKSNMRKCRVCGCTDDDCRQCIARNGTVCHWVEFDLCSGCQTSDTQRQVLQSIMDAVRLEVLRATRQHGEFHSAHEAYGVLVEEVDEFWEEVRKKSKVRSKLQMRTELIQVAAVAIKTAISLKL